MLNKILFLLLTFHSVAKAANCGSLAAVQGHVDVLRNQAKVGEEATRFIVQGKNFLPLECDDVVVTRSQSVAKIIFATGKISMAPDSRLEIASHLGPAEKPEVNIVGLAYGKVRALIQKKTKEQNTAASPSQTSFQIRTHTAVAGVRGTDFYVSYDPNNLGTEQATLTGKVEVEKRETHQKLMVGAGQQVVVEEAAKVDSSELAASTKPKVFVVTPIQESTKHDLRIASAVAKDDKDFSSHEAVVVLGSPDSWTIEKEAIPSKYKDLKNEF